MCHNFSCVWNCSTSLIPETFSALIALRIVAEVVRLLILGPAALARRGDAAVGEVLDTLVRVGALDVSFPHDGLAAGLGE